MRHAFTMVEILIASVLLSAAAILVSEMLVSETKQAATLVEDLAVNKEMRHFFQLFSRDVRSASEIVLKPEQQIPETDAAALALVREPVDLTRCRLTLMRNAAAATTRKLRIDYWLVSESGPPAGMPQKSAAVRGAKVQTYNHAGTLKRLYPLVRTESTIDENGVAHLDDDLLIGAVRGLAFYQIAPKTSGAGPRPVIPTVRATLILSAFRPAAGTGHVEFYRQRFETGFTARSIVSSVFEQITPDQGTPESGE
jgi:type II secretory pathway component PulJ